MKISLLGSCTAMATAIALMALAAWQSRQYNQLAQSEVDQLMDADLDHIAQGIFNLVQTENEAVQEQVNHNLNVARHILSGAGEVSLSPEIVVWKAINQLTKETNEFHLPKMLVGGQWLKQNADPAIKTAVVDEIERLIGDYATIFQRVNEQGDMLRVATTVKTEEGQRAIGTYIPSKNLDGSTNPVIASILGGMPYRGRAYVVNAWHLTAYEGIRDIKGNLVGMIYVGVKQKNVESRIRHAVLQTKVGKTGYVYILGGKDQDRGRYIISQHGLRDGEDIWESKDSDGRYIIQAIIRKALTLKPGDMATERYRWQNPREPTPRWKIARLAYYAPWDWVIGTSVYEDELQSYRTVLSDGRYRMTFIMAGAGLGIATLIGWFGLIVARSIALPIQNITQVAETIVKGKFDQLAEVQSNDEIGALARTFNYMTRELRLTIQGLHQARQELETRVQERTAELTQSNQQLSAEVEERKRAEAMLTQRTQELARSNAELEQFAYIASHDLQEPLRMITSYLQLIVKRYQKQLDGDAHEFINFAVEGAKRMRTLINDLLQYSRITTRGNTFKPVEMEAVLTSVISNLEVAIGETDARITHSALPTIMGDATQMAQLLQNLIANAIKFRGKQTPQIHFSAELKEETWVFSLRDNGIGIDSQYFERIFLIFQRLHSQSEYPGTGIGLAVCRKIVERHGGSIWAESEVGKGATFYYTIPAKGNS